MFVERGAPRRNKNKQVVCSQCCHVLRSDNLKRHLRNHQPPQYDVKAKKQKKVGIISREIAIDDDSFEKNGRHITGRDDRGTSTCQHYQ